MAASFTASTDSRHSSPFFSIGFMHDVFVGRYLIASGGRGGGVIVDVGKSR